jgi:type IV pilus assembly protein PilE
MISVAIVAILASIALASYRGQIRKSHRAAAAAYAVDVVAKQQQFLLDRRAYATSVTAPTSSNGLGLAIPTDVSTYYTLAFNPPVDNTTFPLAFTLVLVPQGDQASDPCGSMSISNQLVKSSSGGSNCW